MSDQEMEALMVCAFDAEETPLDPPSTDDWNRLEAAHHCIFPADFKNFYHAVSHYRIRGELLNVSSGRTNGNDTSECAYTSEVDLGNWNPNMVPFFAIGNGDYFCLSSSECPSSPVYFRDAGANTYCVYSNSFEDWIRLIPQLIG
ncbi:MAG: SMI1/KNR4 family protein [Planctomycetaceae bacterium]